MTRIEILLSKGDEYHHDFFIHLMSRKPNIGDAELFQERRLGERRKGGDRRTTNERRYDFRDGSGNNGRPKGLRVWLRSKTNARLGVDRRKQERRSTADRRSQNSHSLLTRDELSDLLSL